MRRLPLLVLAGLAAATVAACGGNPPPAQPGPQANADSIAAAERARQDSIARAEADARAREEAERVARQRAADSLAAMGRTTEAVRTMLAAMIHFDFDKSNIRSGDAGTLDQKVGILQANPNLRIRISGHCDEAVSREPWDRRRPHRDRVVRRGAADRAGPRRNGVGAEPPRRVRNSLRR